MCWCGRGSLAPRSASVRFGSSPLTGPEVADRARAMRGREGMVYAGATPSPRKRVALHLAPPMSSLRFWPTSYDMAGLERFEQSSESESPATKCEAAAAPKDGALLVTCWGGVISSDEK